MRIVAVSGYDVTVPGGVQGQVTSLARALRRLGHEVTVVAPAARAAGGVDVPLVAAGRSFGVPVNGSIAPVAPTPEAVLATRRAVRELAPDVVHVHEPLLPGPPLAAVFCRRPVVATFHRAGSDALYRAGGILLGRSVLHRLDVLTAVSPAAAETARRVLHGRSIRLEEIPNGVDCDRFAAARRALPPPCGRARYKSGEEPVVVVFGRLERRKGVEVVLEALAALARPLRLVVVGDGPERAELERRAAGDRRVRFTGRIGDDELAAVVARADVAVLPALSGESFGVVLLEAMAAGTAVIASDLPGYVLAAGGRAVHVPAGDAASLARELGRLLEDDADREGLAKEGLERAAACSIEVIAARYLDCYERAYRSARGVPGS